MLFVMTSDENGLNVPTEKHSKTQRWWIVSVVGIVFFISCLWCVARVLSISFPSTETLAKNYLKAIIDKNAEAAATTTVASDTGCRTITLADAHKDIDKFGGSDLQDVTVTVVPNIYGSDEGLEFAEVTFKYRRSEEADWQYGEMRLMADTYGLVRGLCGNLEYHGP